MPDRLTTICRFNSAEEAHLWKAKLESEGIFSAVIHDYPYSAGEVELQVKERDVGRASRIVEPIRKTKPVAISRSEKRFALIFGSFMTGGGILVLMDSGSLVALLFLIPGIFLIVAACLRSTR